MTARKPRNQPRKIAKRVPVAIVQHRILAYVTRNGDSRAAEIAKALTLECQIITKHANALCADGSMFKRIEQSMTSNGKEYVFSVSAPMRAEAPSQPVLHDYQPMHTVDPCALPREFFRRGGERMSKPFNEFGPFAVGEVVRGCGFVTSTHRNGRIGIIASEPFYTTTEASGIPCRAYIVEWEDGRRHPSNEAKLRRLKPPASDSNERLHMQMWRDMAGKAPQRVGVPA